LCQHRLDGQFIIAAYLHKGQADPGFGKAVHQGSWELKPPVVSRGKAPEWNLGKKYPKSWGYSANYTTLMYW